MGEVLSNTKRKKTLQHFMIQKKMKAIGTEI